MLCKEIIISATTDTQTETKTIGKLIQNTEKEEQQDKQIEKYILIKYICLTFICEELKWKTETLIIIVLEQTLRI